MRATMAFLVSLVTLLMAGYVESKFLARTKPTDSHACKVLCQRFGFQALSEVSPDFTSMTSPVVCSKKCEEVYKVTPTISLLARTKPKDSHACKVLCQRFAFQDLSEVSPDFTSMTSPVVCSRKCD